MEYVFYSHVTGRHCQSHSTCKTSPSSTHTRSHQPSVSPACFSTSKNSSSSLKGTSGMSCLKYSEIESNILFSCTHKAHI